MTRATAIADDFLSSLIARFPQHDWDAILNTPGDATVQEVIDAAIALGVPRETVELMASFDPPGFTQ